MRHKITELRIFNACTARVRCGIRAVGQGLMPCILNGDIMPIHTMRMHWTRLKRLFLAPVLAGALAGLVPMPAAGQDITVVADSYPPYNYIEDDRVTGASTEVVRAVLKVAGVNADIMIMPWARAYRTALNEKNVLIFTITRSENREDLFKWVGPVSEYNAVLFRTAKRTDIRVNSLDEAYKYRIGATRDDAATQFLIAQGFDDLQQVHRGDVNVEKLLHGRIDLWLENELTAAYFVKRKGHDPVQVLRKAFDPQKGKKAGYMAFSLTTPDRTVELFKAALSAVKANGTYTEIQRKYR